MEIGVGKKAEANPTKGFFVRMITRDIALEDCILDLIDNSVDSAWRREGSLPVGLENGPDLSAYEVSIDVTRDRFCIRDNCGGMRLEDAEHHAFSFGRKPVDELDDYSIGVYGIGMKRAIFKIGNQATIRSTYQEGGEEVAFAVPVDVAQWLANDRLPWDFEIVNTDPLDEDGVEVEVTDLTPGAATSFSSPAFLAGLKRTIARDYTFHLNKGLVVKLNGHPIEGWKIELRESDDFKPMRFEYEDAVEGANVHVEVIGGMAAPPPDDSDPAEDQDGNKKYGWYVVCNGRIVLAADKTTVSGWGTDDWPQWHRQYDGFIGVVLFSSPKAIALPLTTTKRSVDTSSEVYKRARPLMREVARKWIDYTNQRKQSLDEAKAIESRASAVAIYQVAKRREVALPRLVQQSSVRMATISYSVEFDKLKALAKGLGNINMPHKEVGIKSFDYTYDDLVGGE